MCAQTQQNSVAFHMALKVKAPVATAFTFHEHRKQVNHLHVFKPQVSCFGRRKVLYFRPHTG